MTAAARWYVRCSSVMATAQTLRSTNVGVFEVETAALLLGACPRLIARTVEIQDEDGRQGVKRHLAPNIGAFDMFEAKVLGECVTAQETR